MAINVQIYGRSAIIAIVGNFDFNIYRDFTDAHTQLLNNIAVHEIMIDMSEVNHIDDSALGMLLLLHYRAIAANKMIVLVNLSHSASTVWSLVFDHIKRVIASIGPPQNIRWLANFAGVTG